MSTLTDVAKRMTKAWEDRDEAAFRACLHDDYSFNGPMMEMKSANEAVEFMRRCVFEFTNTNCEVVVEGKTLVHVFDWNVTAPFQAIIPMVEVMEVQNPAALPRVIPSIFRGLWRILWQGQKQMFSACECSGRLRSA